MFIHESTGRVMQNRSGFRSVSLTLLGCAIAVLLMDGCGRDQGPERVVVSGTVTYNGKPIPEAAIRFIPTETSSPAPISGATIKDGQYKVDVHGGIPVGTHKVQIEAYRAVKAGPDHPGPLHPRASEQYIPKKYNVSTQLEITIQPGSRTLTKDFALTD